jgi:hypothetical protein
MNFIIDCRTADIHPDFSRVKRFKFFFFAAERVLHENRVEINVGHECKRGENKHIKRTKVRGCSAEQKVGKWVMFPHTPEQVLGNGNESAMGCKNRD